MAESKVKVGVRIRPLLPKEKGQNITFNSYDKKSVCFKGQTYTFDHVFGMELSQYDLYAQTAAPMLKSFMEGYNCTIMAYGQTGSGKTFSMGTSDIANQDTENQGLISRFVTDLFGNLNAAKAEGELISYQVKASYLEIYGEDVFDLLPSDNLNRSGGNRVALQVREDEAGKIFVQGQNEFNVGTVEATLDLLSSGARHRITASTAMNAESSRSHSVFTLQLEQSVRSGGSGQVPEAGAEEGEVQVLCAKLTFVDLAGSERIKRTGAEGQRLKEGIQINSGLFNLGQVINSLADEQKLKSGQAKTNHVPYRNSKLTHLLKDALGGNSQTLFLACVSPAESNESETQSTLQYAKQARNIQNKPVQNVDKVQRELQRLRTAVKLWTMRAVVSTFGAGGAQAQTGADLEKEAAALMTRPDVSEFVTAMNNSINEKSSVGTSLRTARKVRLSMGAVLSPSPMKGPAAKALYSPVRPIRSCALAALHGGRDEGLDVYSPPFSFPGVNGAYMGNGGRESILYAFPSLAAAVNTAASTETEETERLLARMMDMVQKEKEQLVSATGVAGTASLDVMEEAEAAEPGAAAGEGEDALNSTMIMAPSEDIVEMDRTIQEKEQILLKLQETVKGYAAMKQEFEKLLAAINGLEEEKQHLEAELDRAKRLAEQGSSATNSSAANAAALDRIKERFAKVNNELKAMREEKKGKESAFRLMQRENKQCETLQKELKKLKENRVQMAKQQKTQALQMQKLKKDQVQKAIQFKKADVKKQQLLNTLKSELVKKERVLGHKDREIARISMKLKACEDHITQLLKLQNKARSGPAAAGAGKGAGASGIPTKAGTVGVAKGKINLSVGEAEHLQSSKAMLEHMLIDRLDRHISRILYEQKAVQLAELNREVEADAAALEDLLQQKKAVIADMRARGVLPPAAGAAEAGQEGGDAVTPEEAEMFLEEEVDLGALCGAANNGLSEEEKYQISQLRTSIDMCESSLERLTKEVDICNADIDELSLRMEAEGVGKGGKGADPDGTWDEMGREIVAGLTQGQSHALLWDLMDEKLKTLEQLRIAHSALSKTQADLVQQTEKCQELNDWVAALRVELKTRLERAEKSRVEDMWALMQASNGSNTAEDSASAVAREDAASRIAILRAHELEKELAIALNAEDELKEQLQDKAALVRDLQKRVSELSLRAEFAEAESTWTDVGGFITDGDHSEELRSIGALTNREASGRRSSLQSGPDSYMDKLFAVWEVLGLPEDERSEALEYVQKARALAKERAVVDAEAHLACVKKEVEVATERLNMLCAALGRKVEQLVPELASRSTNNAPLLLPLLAAINAGNKQAEEEILQKFVSLGAVKDRLTEVMSEMWLEINDLTPALRPLAKLVLPVLAEPTEGEDGAALAASAVSKVAEQLTGMKASLTSMGTWESEIKKLNLVRVQITSKLVVARDASLRLLSELQFSDVKAELSALMKGAALSTKSRDSGAEDQLSQQAVKAAVQILATNSASNPPGSEKLLAALERVKLVLESVKVNRSTVAEMVARFVESYTGRFPQGAEAVLRDSEHRDQLQSAKENQICGTAPLTGVFSLASAVKDNAAQLNASLRADVAALLVELAPGTSSEQCVTLIAQHLAATKTAPPEAAVQLVKEMAETVEELEGFVMFLEEDWVQTDIKGLVSSWGKTKLAATMSENAVLWEEVQRLQGLCEAHRELVKADAALKKHVQEMDDFEEKSKQDRAKALSGNSRLLVEEEKFRKAGKKKYEQLSERMLQLFAKLNSLSSGISGPHIDVRPSLDGLSAKGKGLLKGRFKEKIELMHLQLSSAGPAGTTSGPSPTAHSGIPVPSAATATAAKTTKKAAPGPVANVFDFATAAEGVPRAGSHDHSAPEKGVAAAGRTSTDSGAGSVGEKENQRRAVH